MAFEVRVLCNGAAHPNGFLIIPNVDVIPYAGSLSYFHPSSLQCLDSVGNTYPPLRTGAFVIYAPSLEEVGLLISAVALCWGVAWVLKRVIRAFGWH